jgi:hypothetical protein
MVDRLVWEKIRVWTLDQGQLRQEIEDYQAEKDRESSPYRARLAVVDDLLRRNQAQLDRLLDLYLGGDFPKEMLTERKLRLEDIGKALEQERANLVAALEAHTLTQEQIDNIFVLAAIVREAIAEGDKDFATRRMVIETLKPQVRLYVEDGRKMVWVSCVLGKDVISLDDQAISTMAGQGYTPFVLTARIVLPARQRRAA